MTLYDDLGVKPDASPDDIKSAYRERSKTANPDVGGKPEEFHKINQAYEVLYDPARRAKYDRGEPTDEPPTIDVIARNNLVTLFINLMSDQSLAIEHTPIFDLLREQINNGKQQLVNKRKAAEKDIKRLEKVRERIKGKDDFFKSIVNSKIEGAKKAIEQIDNELKIGEIMIKLLDGYEYKHDPLPGINAFVNINWGTA
jgi:curved DNA-binding protein CbpA